MTDQVTLQHHSDPARAKVVVVAKRDDQGRIVEGWVENGRFTLRADHVRGVFWQAEFPRMVVKTSMYTGWDE